MTEPVSIELARAQCSIDEGDDTFDTLLTGYIAAARDWVERYTGHKLVQGDVVETLAGFPCSPRYIELTYRPVVSVDSIAYTDTDEQAQEFEDFTAMLGRYPLRIYEASGASWPSILDNSGVTVTYTAGYDAGDEPAVLLQSMLILIDAWFEDRAIGRIPQGAIDLAEQCRPPGL